MSIAVREPAALELLAALERSGAITPTSLHLEPETRYETWEALGTMLGRLNRTSSWLIGDWLVFGDLVYGERYAQAAEDTGLAPQTLMNLASIARRVPPERRREHLPFSTHAIVAPLSARDQERWLTRAEDEGWSRRELKAAIEGDTTVVDRHNCPDCGREHVIQGKALA